jgi:hypothetical protein
MTEARIPKLTHHKASGQAVVRLSGSDCYLGPWGSRTARDEYDRRIAEWLAPHDTRQPIMATTA